MSDKRKQFALAIHGGAGAIDLEMSHDEHDLYQRALESSLTIGRDILAKGGTALDCVEQTVRALEDDELFNAGKGAVFNDQGRHELDASIMDGKTLACGGVGSVITVKNPITLARLVMEKSGHVLLIGAGAEQFADFVKVERVPNSWFDTSRRKAELDRRLASHKHGTVGCVALDSHGNLAAATSTGGLTAKRFGRVGDSPIIGAGTFADNASCAVSCTGKGEEFIRLSIAHDIAAMIEYKGLSIEEAVKTAIFEKLKPNDGGVIAVDRFGNIAMHYNTKGMYRACADSDGRFEARMFD